MKCTLKTWKILTKPINQLIIQASSIDESDSWQPHPIGMSWQYQHLLKTLTSNTLQIGSHNQTVFSAFSPTTDYNRRSNTINRICILNVLAKNGIHNYTSVPHEDYFKALPNFKFVISPEGNGIDTHRTYEALLAGCIPIVERNPLMEEKYKGCPILWTTDYNEITKEYLEEKYAEMVNKEYDFSRLFLSFYSEDIQENIKTRGDYWTNRMNGVPWYKEYLNTINSTSSNKISVAYAFIGKLPEYAITSAYQLRLFYKDDIYFILDDLENPFVERLQKECNIQIIPYQLVKHNDFTSLLERCEKKFPIVGGLTGRERLFIHSFERFYVLTNMMKLYGVSDIFFIELDNMIYDNPNKWLPSFRKYDMMYMCDNINRASSGIAYIKNTDILDKFCKFSSSWIEETTDFVNEMTALFHFCEKNGEKVAYLPTHWPDHKYPSQVTSHFEDYESLFDPLAYGCYLGGIDKYHTHGHIIRGLKIHWSIIDCREYRFKWEEDEEKRKVPYVWSGEKWLRINNLHIHSKDLEFCFSRFPSQLLKLT